MKFRVLLVIWFFFESTNLVTAQPLEMMKFRVLDKTSGLSGHWITDIALDSSGFVWVGTLEGLNRYDGNKFINFKHDVNDKKSLLSDLGQKVFVNADGKIWISYAEGGISVYNPECRCFDHQGIPGTDAVHLPDKDFGVKFIDGEGNVWFSGNGKGLNIYIPAGKITRHWDLPEIKEKFSKTDNIENNTIHHIYKDEKGLYWLATQNGLYSFDRNTEKFVYYQYNINNPKVRQKASFNKLIPEGERGFWVASWEGGLNFFEKSSGTFYNYLFENNAYGYYNLIFDMVERNSHEIYIVSGDRGLGIFNKLSGKLEFNKKLQNQFNPEITFLTKILKLPSGIIFMADQTALLKFNPENTRFIFKTLQISSSQHGDLFAIRKIQTWLPTGHLAFATDMGNGLNIRNPHTGLLKSFDIETRPGSEPQKKIRNLLFDKKNRLWVISRDYIYHLTNPDGPMFRAKGLQSGQNTEIVQYVNGYREFDKDLWILTNKGTVHWLNTENGILNKPLTDPLTEKVIDDVSHIAFAGKNNLYIIQRGRVFFLRLNNDNQVVDKMAIELNGAKLSDVKGMQVHPDGTVWILLNRKGLLNISEKGGVFKYKLITRENGLPDNRLYGLGIDTAGRIWMSARSGVLRYLPYTNKFELINNSSGMDKFSMSMNFFNTDAGEFYISTLSRYCKVTDWPLKQNYQKPDIYIDEFRVFDKVRKYQFSSAETLVLAPGEDFFSFDFGSRNFGEQSTLRFSHVLEGWDKGWINDGERRHVSYTNIPAGSYTFKVKLINDAGIESDVAIIPIVIQTHFYRQAWFLLLISVLLSLMIFMIYRLRIKKIRNEELIKTRLNEQIGELRMEAMRSQMNPHFVFNCLNSINSYIIKNEPKTSSLYLTRFATLMRMVLDNSRHKLISLDRELKTLELYIELEAFRFERKFSWEIKVEPGLATESIEVPPLIIQPFVENAIWHGLSNIDIPGELNIFVRRHDNFLCVEILDNGIGRSKSAEINRGKPVSKTSHGQKITEERLDLINRSNFQSVEINDICDSDGNVAGTKVLLFIDCLHD